MGFETEPPADATLEQLRAAAVFCHVVEPSSFDSRKRGGAVCIDTSSGHVEAKAAPKPDAKPTKPKPEPKKAKPRRTLPPYSCPACTFINPSGTTRCQICGTDRPPVQPSPAEAAEAAREAAEEKKRAEREKQEAAARKAKEKKRLEIERARATGRRPCEVRHVRVQLCGEGVLALSQIAVIAKPEDKKGAKEASKKDLRPPVRKGSRVLLRARGHSNNTCYVENTCVSCNRVNGAWALTVESPYTNNSRVTLAFPPGNATGADGRPEPMYLVQPETLVEPYVGARVTAPFGDESAMDHWAWYCGEVREWKAGVAKVKFDDGTEWSIQYPSCNIDLLDTSKPNRLTKALVGGMQPNDLPMFVLVSPSSLTAGRMKDRDRREEFVVPATLESFDILDSVFSAAAVQGVVDVGNRWSVENDGADPLTSGSPLRVSDVAVQGFLTVFPVMSRCHVEVKLDALRELNKMVLKSLPYVNMMLPAGYSALTDMIKQVKPWIFTQAKLSLLRRELDRTRHGSSKPRRDSSGPSVSIDVIAAGNVTMKRQTDHKARRTFFGQLYQALRHRPASVFRLGENQRAFRANCMGWASIDAGGPYREVIENIAREVQSPALPLFIRTPNGRADVGLNRDAFVPRTSSKSLLHARLYKFLGRLFGLALRTKTLMNLNFPSIVWKPMVGDEVTEDDVKAVDSNVFQTIEPIQTLISKGVSRDTFDTQFNSTRFEYLQSDGKRVPLLPGGGTRSVKLTNYKQFIRLYREARLREFEFHCSAMRSGLGEVVPLKSLALMTWRELEMLVCGEGVTARHIEVLQRMTRYSQCDKNDPHILLFWRMMTEVFDDRQRSQFIKFAWGRSRLPNVAADYEQKFKIVRHNRSAESANPDDHFPIAHTCFFQVELPRYTTLEAMCKRVVFAIEGCGSIDVDGGVNGGGGVIHELEDEEDEQSFWD